MRCPQRGWSGCLGMTVGAAPQIALLLSPHAVLLLSLNASAASAAFAAAAALEEAMARGEGGAAARAAASGATWRSQIPRAVVLGTGAFSFFMRLASRLGSRGWRGRV